ncbi:MAG: hypothetical protein M1813_007408 [Trichoglossum hirsutum]|nr:MAG: hypothetical protein M1813_007408 [Trichoglossum hirsutum]
MQQPLRPRGFHRPAASKLARPVSSNSDPPQAQLRAPLRSFVLKQDSNVIVSEDPPDRNPLPKPSRDAAGSPSRLPAPKIPRLHGDGGGIGGAKRRSMLPQLSPTKGLTAVLDAGRRERGRTNEDADESHNGRTSPALGACNAVDNMRNPPPLGSAICHNSKANTLSDGSSGRVETNTSIGGAPGRQAIVKRSDLIANLLPTDYTNLRQQNLLLTKTSSDTTALRPKPPPSDANVAGSREMITSSGRVLPTRQPATHITAIQSEDSSRDTTSRPGFSIPMSVGAAAARPRSMVLTAGRDCTQEKRPASSTSANSAGPALLEKSDSKRQHPTNVVHRRTPSTRSTRTTLSSKPKELERKEAISSSRDALSSAQGANVAITQQKKPVFSTMQQHFTPKRALKAPTSFGLATTAVKQANGELISPEVARLQTELLQLHIMHRSSAEVSHAWQQSAESKLRKRFEDVAQEHRKVVALEREMQAQLNLRALKEFSHESGTRRGLGERIQTLGSVIPEIVNITGAGGKYARLVRGFERWIEWTEQIWEARDHDGRELNSRGELDFVQSLGDGWRDETASLSRKLGLWLQELDGVGSSFAGSSLSLVLTHCRCLTEGMMQELEVMRGLEREIVARESRWVSEKVAEISAETDAEFVQADSVLPEKGRKTSTSKQGIWKAP